MNPSTKHKLSTAIAGAFLAASSLWITGCVDEQGQTAASSSEVPGLAAVGLSIAFPDSGPAAARIDEDTTSVRVEIWDSTSDYYWGTPTQSLTLERPSGGGTVTADLTAATGQALIRVTQLQASPTGGEALQLESVNVIANLAVGGNPVAVSMIRAAWTLQSPVTFNKTLASDTTRLNSFSLMPPWYMHQPTSASIDEELYWHATTTYGALLKGSNLCTGPLEGPVTCDQSQLNGFGSYFNTRGVTAGMPVMALLSVGPGNVYGEPDQDGEDMFPLRAGAGDLMRGWIMQGVEESDPSDFSDPAAIADIVVNVLDGSTISGNLIEILIRQHTTTETCYSDADLTESITCPPRYPMVASASPVPDSLRPPAHGFVPALKKALRVASVSPARAAANANGCYPNLVVTWDDSWPQWYYNPATMMQTQYYIREQGSDTVDACRHAFRATATQLPASDLPDEPQMM